MPILNPSLWSTDTCFESLSHASYSKALAPSYFPGNKKQRGGNSQSRIPGSSPPLRTLLAEGMSPAHTVTEWFAPACHPGSRVCRESTRLQFLLGNHGEDSKQNSLRNLGLELWEPPGGLGVTDWSSWATSVRLLCFPGGSGLTPGLIHLAHSACFSHAVGLSI